jgi:hypothetical protein
MWSSIHIVHHIRPEYELARLGRAVVRRDLRRSVGSSLPYSSSTKEKDRFPTQETRAGLVQEFGMRTHLRLLVREP